MLLKIRPEDRVEGTIGKETAANIGRFFKDQYEKIPEDKRKGFEQGVSEAATGIQEWNKQLREENYHGGIGPLDPFIAAGKAYNFVAEPIKKELSIQTGLAPAWIEAGEVAADFLLPGIPLTAASKGKKLKKAVDYTSALNVLDDTTLLNKKIRKILATNSNYSYRQARELALLELKGIRPTGKLYSDRPDRGGLMDGAPIDEQSMWNAQQNKQIVDDTTLKNKKVEVPQLARMFFARSGLRNGIFNLDIWRQAGSDRNVMELFQTRWDQVPYRTKPGKQFTSTRKRLIGPFLEEHGDYLKRFNIDPSTVELHHIFGVNLSAPLYDGLQYGSKEWTDMTDLLNRMGVFPGAPGTDVAKKSNLMLALEEPHDLLHRQFFKDTIGVKGEKFFTPERIDLIRSGSAGRNQVAQEYAKIIKQGETLIQRGMNQIQNVFGKTDVSPEKLADAFSQSLADGTTNIFKEGYKIESVNEVIKDLVFDIQIDEMITPLKQKAFGTIDDLKQEILLDRAAGLTNKQLKKKYGKKFDIRQFDLFE